MSHAPTITPFYSWKPCPRAEVLFTSFVAGTATVTVHRKAGGQEKEVRGAIRAAVAGALTRIDMEIPGNGTPVTYRAEMFNAAGVPLGFTDSTTITMHVRESWVHNPLDPQGAIPIEFRPSAARSIVRPTEGSVVYPTGRRVGVLVSGQRRGVQGVDLTVVTDTLEHADKLQAMFGTYDTDLPPILCFRLGTRDRVRLPSPFFAAVLAADEQDVNLAMGLGEQITTVMQGDEVAPPAPGLFIPLLTRADLNAYYSTRAALNADNASRLAVNRRYDLIGASNESAL
ncbi:hypothetical protein [Cryobacterium cryoconiti]|uniref:Uncharacterized protein n=1 Tax=Cryobacterium cryoconiti TaxID=1259239 RepID=A0A4Y8JU55_9MICO|nr:hypothetical protein [Cryobacterium cryoconiti]TFD27527.1 hypothetical protein E3T49_13375 [Cryobacterium cryoconiti]